MTARMSVESCAEKVCSFSLFLDLLQYVSLGGLEQRSSGVLSMSLVSFH